MTENNVTMTLAEFQQCIKAYEDKGFWSGAPYWIATGIVVTALVALPLAYIGASMGLFLGIQQEVKK